MNRREYLLTSLAEECAELSQRISKALRFGVQEKYQGKTNEKYICEEFTDLLALVKMLDDEGVIRFQQLISEEDVDAKIAKVERYFGYANECGTITPSFVNQPSMEVQGDEVTPEARVAEGLM